MLYGNKKTVSSLSCQQRALSDHKTAPKSTNYLVFLRRGEAEEAEVRRRVNDMYPPVRTKNRGNLHMDLNQDADSV